MELCKGPNNRFYVCFSNNIINIWNHSLYNIQFETIVPKEMWKVLKWPLALKSHYN